MKNETKIFLIDQSNPEDVEAVAGAIEHFIGTAKFVDDVTIAATPGFVVVTIFFQ